jgi:hypothetical protein
MKVLLSDDGKQVIGVEINGDNWYLSKPMPISSLEELTRHVKYVIEHFKFGSEREWTDEELLTFLKNELTDGQKIFFACLANTDGWVSIDVILNSYKAQLDANAYYLTMAGIQAALTRKCRELKKENFWEKKWVDNEGKNQYRIKPKYLNIVKRALVSP